MRYTIQGPWLCRVDAGNRLYTYIAAERSWAPVNWAGARHLRHNPCVTALYASLRYPGSVD